MENSSHSIFQTAGLGEEIILTVHMLAVKTHTHTNTALAPVVFDSRQGRA